MAGAHVKDAPEFLPGSVLQAKTGGYLVQSRTVRGTWYLVFGRSCSCKAGQSGSEVCWHRTQVARFVKALEDTNPRPRALDTGEAVTSRFVD